MDTTSPPLSPIRQYIAPREASPNSSYRDQLRRRTSSFSSNHDRSPTSTKPRHRFSNASQYSHAFDEPSTDDLMRGDEGDAGDIEGGGGGGLGNLADELDQLDDEDDYDEDGTEGVHASRQEPDLIDGARDSGIDVSYASKHGIPHHARPQSKPFGATEKPPDEVDEDEGEEERFSADLEDLMRTVARMASSKVTSAEDPLIPRAVALMQDLGNQTSLEAAAQRLTTSTNSTAAHLAVQTKAIQTLLQALYPIFATAVDIDTALIEDTLPLTDSLPTHLPQPDAAVLKTLQKFDRETSDALTALSQITDTLQMGKQITGTAARHLRTTQTMVVELREEREKADLATFELAKSPWPARLQDRHCAAECRDILAGFESTCEEASKGLSGGVVENII